MLMPADPPGSAEILCELRPGLAETLRVPGSALDLVPLDGVTPRADAPGVFGIVDNSAQPRAVLLCSAPAFPDMVDRAMRRAAGARACLRDDEAAAVLVPLLEGRVRSMSYSVLRYCRPLSNRQPLWLLQRRMLRPRMLEWLYRVSAATLAPVDPAKRGQRFGEPLDHLASLDALSAAVRTDARRAARRLADESWRPRHVLMHGDLWKGNILIDEHRPDSSRKRWQDRFVVIDWPGSEREGHAVYDLMRLARSMNLGDAALRTEISRHCRLLDADPEDAMGYLLTALGHIGLHLEEFPMARYVRMVEACHDHLRRVVGEPDRNQK